MSSILVLSLFDENFDLYLDIDKNLLIRKDNENFFIVGKQDPITKGIIPLVGKYSEKDFWFVIDK